MMRLRRVWAGVVVLAAMTTPVLAPDARATTVVREPLITMIKALPVSVPSHGSTYNRTTDFGGWTYHAEPYGHCDTRAVVLTQESKAP